jgi:glycosyltransferase involved in cell wall biosynthesis
VKNLINISVIIPAYNRDKTIRYCIDSVLGQSVPPSEVIVVDDCSTDGTAEIVRRYSDSRVRCVVLDRNSGAQVARNRGIKEAQCEWIAFQDSDDEWLPGKLEKQIATLAEVNFDPMTVVHGNGLLNNHQNGRISSWNLPYVHGTMQFNKLLESVGPAFPAILTSKKALEAIGFLDEAVPSFQEWDTSILLARVCRFIHIQHPIIIYHLHGGDTISKDRKRELDGYSYIVNKYWDDILHRCGVKVLNRHLGVIAVMAMRNGDFQKAETILAKAIGKSFALSFLKWRAQARSYPSTYVRLDNLLQSVKLGCRKICT